MSFAPAAAGDDAPLLVELRRRLEATDEPAERCALDIRRALYLVRTNRLAEAGAVPAQVRSDWAGREDLRVYVWLWILEGVLALYRDSLTNERPRLLQAQAAAVAAGWRAEAELASAWLAHLAYVDGDYQAMLEGLQKASLGTAALDETTARSTLTLACALQWFGEDAAAQTWFGHAREAARSTGDRAGIMAATANRLMLKLSDNWLNFCFGESLRHESGPLREELLGILGYEELSGSASLQEQNEVATLRLDVINGDHESALALASAMHVAVQRHSGPALATASVVHTWLLSRRADVSQASALLAGALHEFEPALVDDDDAASSWALLAQVAHVAQQPGEVQRLKKLADDARARYRAPIDDFRPALLALEAEASGRWVQN